MRAARVLALVPLLVALSCEGTCAAPRGPDGGTSGDAGGRSEGDAGELASFTLRVLSGRADMVTGGDALLELASVGSKPLDGVRVTLDGEDVSERFHALDETLWLARVEGLPLGEREVVAARGAERVELTLVNHPQGGPVFSGPHQRPFVCMTEQAFLGPPLDDDCSAAPIYVYRYLSTDGSFKNLAAPSPRPPDMATTTTSEGRTVDFLVRIEVGTINRAIYWIAALHDESAPAWEPWAPSPTWNGRLLYLFGGGCGAGYIQGDPSYWLIDASAAAALGRGHAVAHASLNTLGNNCNDVLSAETLMMVKERFIERYGVPRYTMGWGGSGGSIQQHLIADNYPGLLDGLLPSISYPDIWSLMPDVFDCRLLLSAFDAHPELWADEEQKRAVTGYGSLVTCETWAAVFADLIVPDEGCLAGLPAEEIYDPLTNPEGARCTLHDHNRNLLGTDPETGFARRPYDNVGVQYGLRALEEGLITVEQFLDLNERVGGFDDDGRLVPTRTAASAEAIRAAYEGGRVLDGGLGLKTVPIIDTRPWLDEAGDIHDAFRTDSTRARLVAANGDADNHVAFIAAPGGPDGQAGVDALLLLEEWLDAFVEDDDADRRAALKRTRPAALRDRCYITASPDEGRCEGTFPRYQSPRLVAGAPLANDVLQCALKPVAREDYPVPLDDVQLARLEAIFPSGVCDYEAPPPNRVPHRGAWQRYGP